MNPQTDPTLQVSALAAITRPMGNTKLQSAVYFKCTMPTASMHRQDGKKLPFVQGFFKAEFQEDYDYLMEEIGEHLNPYIALASPDEITVAKHKENPVAAIKEAVKAEIENTYSISELEALIERRKTASVLQSSASKIQGVDKPKADPNVVVAQGATSGHQPHAAHTGMTTAKLGDMVKGQ